MARVLIPLPARDFDPTEAAVPWQALTARGHAVAFATPDGAPAEADAMMLDGRGLDPWGRIPALRSFPLVGLLLRADARGRAAHAQMVSAPEFRAPLAWEQARAEDFDGLLLPGGHRARGMRAYLESPLLQALVAVFFARAKPVAAICHGVLLAARSRHPATGRSVLHGYRTTALTWAQERAASRIGRVSRFWDPFYYRTYREGAGEPEGYMSVEHEVKRALARPADFQNVPDDAPDHLRKTLGLWRDTPTDARPAFVVRDRNYVSARWPGDAHAFAAAFADVLDEAQGGASPRQ